MKQTSDSNDEKVKTSVYLEKDLSGWIDKKVKDLTFGSRNHAVNFAIKFLKEHLEEKDK